MNDTFVENLPKKEKAFWHRALKVNPKKGLTTALVRRSNTLYGPNRLTVKNAKSLLTQILEHFKELIVILLCIASILSFILGIITVVNGGEVVEYVSSFIEAIIIAGIIFTNIFLSIRQSDKTDKALETLKSLVVPMAKVVRNGKTRLIPSANVVPGDIMILEAGESIAADAKLIEVANLKIDEAVLTGESEEVEKDAHYESTDDMPIGDRKDWVFSGTAVTNGSGTCQVIYTGMKTQVGQIAKLLDQEKTELTPLQKQIAKLSKIIGIIAVSVCVITFILYMVAMTGYTGFATGVDSVLGAINVSVVLAIASIPETLLAVVSIILAISVQRMSKQNALIKRLPAIETLGNVSIVCSDKTGTLTKNVMTVVKTWSPQFPLQVVDAKKPNDPNLELYRLGTLCSDAKVYKERNKVKYIGDSTETAILKGLVKQGIDYDKLVDANQRLGEIPFDADRKMMSVIVPSDKPEFKYMLITKGAPDRIFKHLSRDKHNSLAKARQVNDSMGNNALRVLAVAVKYFNQMPKELNPNTLETKLELVGLFGIIDPPKPEAKIAVKELKQAGIRTIMITGDHKTTAAAIAKELKILQPGEEVVSGADLDLMTDEQLAENVSKYSVYARVSPNDKLRIVKAWKANGQIVSMTGDGVNDAPSLKAADVGCAMGITGTDVAKDSSDMILMDDNFATIVRAIDVGRKVMLNIKSSLTMLLTANLANFLAIFIGILVFYISPLKSLQILFINVAVETLLSFAIARNNRTESVMSFKPKKQNEFIIDGRMFAEILFFGILISGVSLLMFYIGATFTIPKVYRVDNGGSYVTSGNFFGGVNGFLPLFSGAAASYNLTGTTTEYLSTNVLIGNNMQYIKTVDFLNSYHYGSLLCFLTIGIMLSINGLYSRAGGSLFTQKPKDSWFMATFVGIAIVAIGFVSFVPGIDMIFNMKIRGTDIIEYVNYNWYLCLPFASGLGLIIIAEIYRAIIGIFFNVDGSRKIKIDSKLDKEDDDNDEVVELTLLDDKKNKKKTTNKKTTSNSSKSKSASNVRKTTTTKKVAKKN